MPKGPSGKIVVDLGVDRKRRLHGRLALQGKTVKTWAIECAEATIEAPIEPSAGSGGFLLHKPPTK